MIGNVLLSGAPQHLLDRFLDPAAHRTWAPGEVIYSASQEADRLLFPYAGAAGVLTPIQDEWLLTRVVGSDGAIGLVESYTLPSQPTEAVALTDLSGWSFNRSDFLAASAEERQFAVNLRRYVAFLAVEAAKELACGAYHRGRPRIAGLLGHLFDVSGSNEIRMNQQALANLCGVQRTTANAYATDLKRAGAIQYRRSVLSVTDRAVLDRYSCGCRMSIRQARRDMGLPSGPEALADQQAADLHESRVTEGEAVLR